MVALSFLATFEIKPVVDAFEKGVSTIFSKTLLVQN